jgi:hypothetical protein
MRICILLYFSDTIGQPTDLPPHSPVSRSDVSNSNSTDQIIDSPLAPSYSLVYSELDKDDQQQIDSTGMINVI